MFCKLKGNFYSLQENIMQTKKTKRLMLITGFGIMSGVLAGCFAPKVSEESTLDYSFSAISPIDQSIVTTGSFQNQQYSPEMSQVFEFLKGSKQGEVKTGSLQDPFQKHDPLLVEKVPLVILNQLGINPEKLGEEIKIGENTFIFAGTGSEEGIIIASLDQNSIETAIPLEWQFTIEKIQ